MIYELSSPGRQAVPMPDPAVPSSAIPDALLREREPTETESLETLDRFAEVMAAIREEAKAKPDLLRSAPHFAPVSRVDEVKAAKNLILRRKDTVHIFT